MSISSEITRIASEVNTQAGLIQQIKIALEGKVAGGGSGELVNIYDTTVNPIERGSINATSGADTTAGTRLRTQGHITVQPNTAYKINTNIYKVFVIQYTASGTVITNSGWQTSPFVFAAGKDCASIRIVMANSSDSSIQVSEFEYMTIEYAVSDKEPSLQTKTVTPTKSVQNVTPDSCYDGLEKVTVKVDAE